MIAYKSNTGEIIKEQIILEGWKSFLIMIAPITPHISAELWKLIDKNSSFLDQPWPNVDNNLLKDKKLVNLDEEKIVQLAKIWQKKIKKIFS